MTRRGARARTWAIAGGLGLALAAFAQPKPEASSQRGDRSDAQPLAPEEQQRLFRVPPGFAVELVAAEPQIAKPMNLAFDAAGRIWVTCTELYPFPARTDARGEPIAAFDADWKKAATRFRLGDTMPTPAGEARDRVVILGGFGRDGRAREARVFADGLNIPVGVQPLPRRPGARGDAALVFSIPAIWRLEDGDGDGRAEDRRALYPGFGFEDTHGMSSNYTHWLDGWVYGTHGFANRSEIRDAAGRVTVLESGNTYRFRPDGSRFERWTHGQTNPFGTAFDEAGNLYTADSHSKPVYRVLRGGYYEGLSKKHDGLGFAPAITKDSHGSTGIAGIAYYGAAQFPAEYRGNLFNGNPITRRINRARLDWQGASPTAARLEDFLTCDDPSFRPVQVKLGPDGALYIADFYNPIIGHYEVRLTHPARDRSRGRIWRVVWRGLDGGAPAPALPDLTRDPPAALLDRLATHNVTLRGLAVNQLVNHDDGTASAAWLAAARVRLRQPERLGPGEALGLLHALERVTPPPFDVLAEWAVQGGERGQAALQVLANRSDPGAGLEAMAGALVVRQPPGPAWLELALLCGQHPQAWQGELLLGMIAATPATDPQLLYALKLALKGVVAASDLPQLTAWASGGAAAAAILEEVALAVETAAVAEFLLAQLEQAQFSGPRVGDQVKHAAGLLASERFDALGAIARRLDPQASLAQQLAVCEGLGLAAKRLKRSLPRDLREWTETVVLRALANRDAKIVERAVEAGAGFSGAAFDRAWEKVLLDSRLAGAVRATALRRLPAGDAGVRAAQQALAARPDARLLEAITARLGARNAGDAAQAALAGALPTAAEDQVVPLAVALSRTDSGARRLVELAESGRVSPRLLLRAPVAAAWTRRAAALRERVTALTAGLPPESVRLDEVIGQRVANFRPTRADTVNGARLFALHCAACHRYREAGGSVGPGLDGIGVRGAARLFEDILDPSRNVDPIFQRSTVTLKTGEELVGANLQRTAAGVALSDAEGRVLTFAAEAVATTRTEPVSLMPAAFEQAIAPDDLGDVIAYLLAKE